MAFTLRQISELTSIPIRRIRHVLDQELIAHKRWYTDPEGWASRKLNLDGAVLAAVAAQLVNTGIGRGRVRELVEAAEALQPNSMRKSLNLGWLDEALLENQQLSTFEVGDGTHIRIVIGSRSSGWWLVEDSSPQLDDNFEPFVTTSVKISRIRELFVEQN